MTLNQIIDKVYDGEIKPDMMIEFAEEGTELETQTEYLDELLETHGNREVEWYDTHSITFIKVIFKRED